VKKPRPNLNNYTYIDNDGVERRLDCKSVKLSSVNVNHCEASFRNIKHSLMLKISDADYVFICCYSIGDLEFLEALGTTKGASIITDISQWRSFDLDRRNRMQEIIRSLAPCISIETEGAKRGDCSPYRRLSTSPMTGVENPSIMHNKFIVFCEERTIEEEVQVWRDSSEMSIESYKEVVPTAVWLGSYNFTFNAPYNLESAVYIEQKEIAAGFLRYWNEIYKICDTSIE
jgi:hypothetical protein